MNDKFLKDFRIEPRPAFVQDLSLRLQIHEEQTSLVKTHRLRPIAFGAITLLLILAFMFTISPAARAQVQDWFSQVGGVFFTATGDYPGGDEPVTIVPSEEMSLIEARAVLPFTVDLPVWVPEGYVLEETVNILRFGDGVERVFIHWNAPGKALLELKIEDAVNSNWAVGLGSIEEVLINGKSAALVRGGWNFDKKQWENQGQLQLYVPHEAQTYIFSSMEKDISIDELILIAESLP